MKTCNIALLGAGTIAAKMVAAIQNTPGAVCYAVASRELAKAQAFAAEHGLPRAFGSYEEMLADSAVDLVYVATPHSHHAQHAQLCIRAKKPVICEKPFTANAHQAEETLALAQEKGVFITEAIWTRYMPLAAKLRSLVDGGAIGDPVLLEANLGYANGDIPRMAEPSLAGGALLDLGVYPVNFAAIAFGGEVQRHSGSATLTEKGVDAQNTITLHYPEGRLATLYSTMRAVTNRQGIVYGTKGRIEVDACSSFEELRVLDAQGNLVERHKREEGMNGYEYQFMACLRALDEGRLECPEMPHAEILRVARLLDDLRRLYGVRYPFD